MKKKIKGVRDAFKYEILTEEAVRIIPPALVVDHDQKTIRKLTDWSGNQMESQPNNIDISVFMF